jgi:hypothetical protein
MPNACPRVRLLPAQGTLLVSPDLHGNGADFRRLRDLFQGALRQDPASHWVLLGDSVHAPNPVSRRKRPDLYDFEDESRAIVLGIAQMQRAHPGQVHYILGNHDHAHVGGRRTAKFYPDEAAHLESLLAEEERAAMHDLFRTALLAVVAPCGVLLAHGSPGDELRALADLDRIPLPLDGAESDHAALVESFTESYGRPREVTERLLALVSRDAGFPVRLVIHGHDRDEAGYFAEHDNQVCPVLFGAPPANKRYLRLDLAGRYESVDDLRQGREVCRLWEGAGGL